MFSKLVEIQFGKQFESLLGNILLQYDPATMFPGLYQKSWKLMSVQIPAHRCLWQLYY